MSNLLQIIMSRLSGGGGGLLQQILRARAIQQQRQRQMMPVAPGMIRPGIPEFPGIRNALAARSSQMTGRPQPSPFDLLGAGLSTSLRATPMAPFLAIPGIMNALNPRYVDPNVEAQGINLNRAAATLSHSPAAVSAHNEMMNQIINQQTGQIDQNARAKMIADQAAIRSIPHGTFDVTDSALNNAVGGGLGGNVPGSNISLLPRGFTSFASL